MPLIKKAVVADHMSGVDFRRRDEMFRKDYIRVASGGMEHSMRGSISKSKSIVVWNTMKSLAEEGVELGQESFDLFARSYQILAQNMSKMFWRARSVGVAPKVEKPLRVLGMARDGGHGLIEIEPGTAWYPVCAAYMDHSVIIIFRVWKINEDKEVDEFNSLSIGIAMSDLGYYFPELESYVERVRAKASEIEEVSQSFAALMKMLRPGEAKQLELAERAKRYGHVESFGAWG